MNIKDKMDLLNITDVSTPRQTKNGTVVWQLPIRVHTHPSITKFIEVASFATGYVRNQNSGYSNYQLNKRCEGKPEYFQLANGNYRKFTVRSCVLIPNEIDRLEYLIAYCLKNYYIKRSNEVTETFDCGHYDRIRNLESDVHNLENKLATIERITQLD